jgi:hypothetical protein
LTPTRPRVVGPESTVASVSPKHGCGSAYRSTPHVLGVDCVRTIPLCGTPYFTQTAVRVSRARAPLVIVPARGASGQPRGLEEYTQCLPRVNLLAPGREPRPRPAASLGARPAAGLGETRPVHPARHRSGESMTGWYPSALVPDGPCTLPPICMRKEVQRSRNNVRACTDPVAQGISWASSRRSGSRTACGRHPRRRAGRRVCRAPR